MDHNIWTSLTSDDPHAARAWLKELGFTEGIVVDDGAGGIRHSEMLWPEGGRVMVSSRVDDADRHATEGAVAVYVVCDDPDAVFARAQKLGAPVLRPLEGTDYGSRGFTVADPDGNRWSFGTYAG